MRANIGNWSDKLCSPQNPFYAVVVVEKLIKFIICIMNTLAKNIFIPKI